MATGVPSRLNQAPWASGCNVLAACWLLASTGAFVAPTAVVASNVVVALVIFNLAFSRMFGATDRAWVGWLNAGLGLWAAASPWVLGMGHWPAVPLAGSNLATGLLIAGLGYWGARSAPSHRDPSMAL